MARTANITDTPTISRDVRMTLSAPAVSSNPSGKSTAKLVDLPRHRNTPKSLAAILTNYIVIVASVLLSEAASKSLSPTIAWLPYTIAVLAIASRLRAFENLVHEASHHNLFSAISLHYTLEPLYSYPVFRDLGDYRASHMQHHKHLGDPERDPDAVRMVELGLDNLPSQPLRLLVGLPASGFLIYEYLTTTFAEFWSNPNKRAAKILYWALIVATFQFTGSLNKLGWYYLVPLLAVLPITRFIAEAAEHTGLDMRGTLGSSRTNNGTVHAWYLHPHNDGFHAAHHLSPQVPFHLLREAHQRCMAQSDDYRRQTVISNGFWETMRQMCTKKTVFKEKVSG